MGWLRHDGQHGHGRLSLNVFIAFCLYDLGVLPGLPSVAGASVSSCPGTAANILHKVIKCIAYGSAEPALQLA